MKRFAALVVFLACLAFPLHAQDQTVIPLALRYDLDAVSGALIYVKTVGPFDGRGLIETSGSSTTVTAFTGNTDAFTDVVVGDVLMSSGSLRAVTAKASAISLTVDTAIDWSAGSGVAWQFYHHEAGTAATSGIVKVGGLDKRVLTFNGVNLQGDTNNLDVVWECRSGGELGVGWTQVYPSNAAAITGTLVVDTIYEAAEGINATRGIIIDHAHADECRLGMAFSTADDGAGDTGANREIINVILSGYAVQ